jgi:hypothetical protein
MRITVRLADPDDELETVVDARDRRAFERSGRTALGLAGNASLADAVAAAPESYVAWVAWHALRRQLGRERVDTFGAFEARIVETITHADGTGDALLPDPTGRAT